MASNLPAAASRLKALHKPGDPIIFANVYDALSAEAVAALPSCSALATASYAVAQAAGLEDDDLTFEINLAAAQAIGKIAAKHNKPLTVDLQDGYGDRLKEATAKMIDAGVVGFNLEDWDRGRNGFFSVDEAVSRIKTVLETAKSKGVPDFAVNARCDVLVHGGELDEVIARGKQYLQAGATSIFVWGGRKRGVRTAEVEKMVEAFDGRLNVSLKLGVPEALSVKELVQIGVSRISIGPALSLKAMETYAREAKVLLESK
ncbi:hypothetical protein MMC10_001645 [Thelotrema lepadinum]|nr:hypothetical protein [Thelotrema lepadinum]